MNDSDNIELRSEKVRNIIGQIPPRIIRSGITVIFIVVIILLTGSYFFKYSYIVKSQIVFTKDNNKITGTISIPANEAVKVKPGQKVIVKFDNIPKMNNEILKSEIEFISIKLEITKEGAFYSAGIKIPDILRTNSGSEIEFTNTITGNVQIITDEISFFERIIQPIKSLLQKDKSKQANPSQPST